MNTENTEPKKASWLRRACAGVLDFITIFAGGGYLIAELTGNTTEGGFQLDGLPALLLFALMIAYFVIGYKFTNGTIWQRILRTRS